jgi:hypothetical protein
MARFARVLTFIRTAKSRDNCQRKRERAYSGRMIRTKVGAKMGALRVDM